MAFASPPAALPFAPPSFSCSRCPRRPRWASTSTPPSPDDDQPPDKQDATDPEQASTSRRKLSAESRAKISAALKGRRKSEAHKENLRSRFTGDQNPMYGRKLSPETRAKISAALRARRQESKSEDVAPTPSDLLKRAPERPSESSIPEDAVDLKKIQDEALNSRLLKSVSSKSGQDEVGGSIDELLNRVASLDVPPDHVLRLRRVHQNEPSVPPSTDTTTSDAVPAPPKQFDKDGATIPKIPPLDDVDLRPIPRRRGRKPRPKPLDEVKSAVDRRRECPHCKVTGMLSCPDCIDAFGVVSSHCSTCFGAGRVFCPHCDGVGTIDVSN